ncbi:MAG: molybdopterin-dependent oxidoreductase [Eubacteriales bacterium]|nr:molybdopterin-dependent oxidoreductase [Eubacteriales bacterium]
MSKPNIVGSNMKKPDSYDKVTGRTKYVADLHFDRMLHAAIKRSPYAHANIKSIDTSEAEAMPGVVAVVSYKDAPDIMFTLCGHPYPADDTPWDTRIFNRRVRYFGEPVAAVAAETKDIAKAALDNIKIEYEVLPFYLTADEALAEDATEIHPKTKNITDSSGYEVGDVDAAFNDPELIIVEDSFKTPIVTHCPIETHISVVDIDSRGRLTFYVSNQVPNIMRERLSYALGLPYHKVRVVKQPIGGSFGGKQEPVYEQINALLTLKANRPVLLELTREEELASTRTRHSGIFKYKTAITKDGDIVAREMSVIQNTGAYSSHGHCVIDCIAGQFPELYPSPNYRFKGLTAYTNILIAGAMRGYGIPQYCASHEAHVDHVARSIDMDPLEYRKKNSFKLGDDTKQTGFKHYTCGLGELMERGSRDIGYESFHQKVQDPDSRKRRGIGLGLSSYASCVFSHSAEMSTATIVIHEDASATLKVGCIDSGQGSVTAMQQIAAEELGIPMDWIHTYDGDTDLTPFDVGEYASRQTYVAGQAVKKAAIKCREHILEKAEKYYNVSAEDLFTEDGNIYRHSTGEMLCQMKEVTFKTYYDLFTPESICHHASHAPTENVLTYGVSFAEVEVDMDTGKVEIIKLINSLDCGKLVNPLLAECQLFGGAIMNLGYGMTEQILIDPKTGAVLNDNMLDYKIPTFADIPDLKGFFAETLDPSSAYGNKALGEPPNMAPSAALHNAVYDATGVWVGEIPLTPERVYAALQRERINISTSTATVYK